MRPPEPASQQRGDGRRHERATDQRVEQQTQTDRRAHLTDDALLTETLVLLRAHPALAESRAHVLSWAQGARNEIMALPDVPARAAFLALCDFVEKRTG